jgi:glyoxalase/bleomycin resistance protein/dioxygenase superfamily protein
MPFRFNHMELTFPKGALDDKTRKEIADFYGDMFGWSGFDVELFNQRNFLLAGDDGAQHFILLAEADKHLDSPGWDHLGVLCDTREEVDALLEKAKRYRDKDDRVVITEFDKDLEQGAVTVHAFYVKYLLPIHLDVQCIEHKDGNGPAKRWQYV